MSAAPTIAPSAQVGDTLGSGDCVNTRGVVHVNVNVELDWGTGPSDQTGACWMRAFESLSRALDVAQPGDQIWVAAGTYTPLNSYSKAVHQQDDARSYSFMLKVCPASSSQSRVGHHESSHLSLGSTLLLGSVWVVSPIRGTTRRLTTAVPSRSRHSLFTFSWDAAEWFEHVHVACRSALRAAHTHH
jgi:hypothetical protein